MSLISDFCFRVCYLTGGLGFGLEMAGKGGASAQSHSLLAWLSHHLSRVILAQVGEVKAENYFSAFLYRDAYRRWVICSDF